MQWKPWQVVAMSVVSAVIVALIVCWVCGVGFTKPGDRYADGERTCERPPNADPATAAGRQVILDYARDQSYKPANDPYGETVTLRRVQTDPVTHKPIRDAAGNYFYVDGPRGAVEPNACSHRNHADDLRSGVVVARITITGRAVTGPGGPGPGARTDTAYGKWHLHEAENRVHFHPYLPEGVSYVWVDSLGLRGKSDSARATIIPDGNPDGFRMVYVHYENHPSDPPHNRPMGRWKQVAGDDHLWEACASTGCCTVQDTPIS